MIDVSIIVPVYNKERFLDESLTSIKYQTFKNIEVICVNDGSTDGSLAILEKYAKDDDRFRIINQSNMGAGAARNNGLDKAEGKYIIFLDADDFFEYSLIERLFDKAVDKDADITICNALLYDEETEKMEKHKWLQAEYIYDDPFCNESVNNIFDITQSTIWNKLYRTAFLKENHIRFQNIKTNNDTGFSIISLFLAKRISYVDECLIYYRKNNDANRIDNTRKKHWKCCSEAYKYVITRLKKEGLWNKRNQCIIYNQMYNSARYELSYYDNLQDALPFIKTMTKLMQDPQRTKLEYYPRGYTSCRYFYLFGIIPFMKSIKVKDGKIFCFLNKIKFMRRL